jgi:hypothetical protein
MTLLLLLSLIAAPVSAKAVIEGIAFDETYRAGTTELQLKGTGLLRYMIFIKAYVGAFYMLPGQNPQYALGATPRHLELEYFHAITAIDFAEATTQKISDNVSPETMAALKDRLEAFNALYRDVQPGDRYGLTYIPGIGTELSLNGQSLGRIQGDDFAAAVFAIWLGPDPIDAAFRDHLLGRQ